MSRLTFLIARSCLIAGLLLLAQAGSAAGQDHRALADAMARGLREEGLVGAVWATVGADSGVSVGAAGRRRADRPEPLAATDRVQVGSVTKTLLATGILQLVTEGKLRLDAPVAAYLPQLEIVNPWAVSRPLLLRHLLDHTSGLDDARLWQLFNAEPRPNTPLATGFDPDRLRLVLRRPPGERFSYSNTGYGLLALVIEAVTGERYETYLDARLLRPLGMANSTFHFVTQSGPGADPRLAMGHFEKGALAPAVPTYLRPAMQFTTTAADMARFARFLMSDGTVGGRPLVDARLLRAMGTPAGTQAARAGLQVGYGLGLSIRDRHGVVGRCHAGNTVGYRAMFCVYPEQRKAFFVAMNADNEDADYARLDSLVITTLRLTPSPAAPVRATTLDTRRWEGTYVISPARFEMFAYIDVVLDFVRVRADRGRIVLAPFQGSPTVLEPMGGPLFRAPGRTLPSHVLLSTERGPALSNGLSTYERVSLWRMVPLWASLVAGVLGLLYVFSFGLYRAARGRLRPADPLLAPFVVALAACIAGVLLWRQPVLQLGDLTATNVFLAVVTGALPIAAALGLWRAGRTSWLDSVALAAVLQWTLVLAVWGLLPLRLWA
ncbi:MAG TPA: serine hydrolase domain-containing protein [Longimicrobium sp.]|jgi:CubicO group peptidase (beta-lactamase class C family)